MQFGQAMSPPPPQFTSRSTTARRRIGGALVALLIAASALVLPSLPAAAQVPLEQVLGGWFVEVRGPGTGTLLPEGESATIRVTLHGYRTSVTQGGIGLLHYERRANDSGAPLVVPIGLDTSVAGSAQAEDITMPSAVTIPVGASSATATVTIVDDGDLEEIERASIVVESDLSQDVIASIRRKSTEFYIRHSDGADLGRLLFRVCEAEGNACPVNGDTGWMETDTPSITLTEGGDPVSYQYKLSEVSTRFDSIEVRPELRHKVVPARTHDDKPTTARLPDWTPDGSPDNDRLTCDATADHAVQDGPVGHEDPNGVSYCPHHTNFVGWDQRDHWYTVTFSAGHDADTLDQTGTIIHATLPRQAWWLGQLGGLYYQDPHRFPVSVTVIDDDDDEPLTSLSVGDSATQDEQEGLTALSVGGGEANPHEPDPQVIAKVKTLAAQTQHGTAHVNRWQRALAGLGALDPAAVSGGAMTAAQAQQMADRHSSPVWGEVVAELTALEASQQQTPPPTPEVNITSAAGSTEGGPVTFTVTANPTPSADLAVSVTVATSGDFGFGTAPTSVTIATSGTATVTVATTDDAADEPDGSVTLTLNTGSDYTVGALSSETATVADDDEPVQEQVVVPAVSIAADGGVTEGASATFTLTASPAPVADLDVTVTVTAAGDYGVAAGTRTVTIPTSGSATLTAATVDDSADEPDGSVTATLSDGADYDLGTPVAAAVTVSDDDPPPLPVVSISGGTGVSEGHSAKFTVIATPAPAAPLAVTVVVAQNGDFGVSGGTRAVTVTTSGSATFSVATADDGTDEPDGSVSATLSKGSGYTVSSAHGTASVAVTDDDEPLRTSQQPSTLVDCSGLPTVSVGDVTASRSDASARFEIALDCTPRSTVTVYYVIARDDIIGATSIVKLTASAPTAVAEVSIGSTQQIEVHIVHATGAANRRAKGTLAFTD